MMLTVFAACTSAVLCAAFLIHSASAADAVRRGIEICGVSVIPSLFPMMFLSQYIVKSGAAELAGGLLDKPVRLLFGLPGICGVALLTAFIGGYPAGARAAESLTADGKITREQGERLADIAFCAGPGFAIGMIGGELYKNKSVGLLILTAQAFSCIIIGTVLKFVFKDKESFSASRTKSPQRISRGSDAFVQSAADTASTMLNMCSFIILFQVIISMLDTTGINTALGMLTQTAGLGDKGKMLLPCAVEVTSGSILSVSAGLPFTAFVAGFGGLSVHFQNFAVCRTIRPKKQVYFLIRIIQGGLCSIIVTFALRLPCFASIVLPVSGSAAQAVPVRFSRVSVGFGCAMIVMCLMSVICLPSEKEMIKS